MEDWDLINKISNDDENAFDFLFNKYYKRLVVYITSYTHDFQQAEDIVQGVFVKFWLNRKTLKIEKSPSAYLFWVSYMAYLDFYRKTKRQRNIINNLKEQALKDTSADDQFYIDLKTNKLREVIETLPPATKKILLLNKFQGLKYHEIAETLDISVKTVESHMRNAFQLIRKGFKGHGFFVQLLNCIITPLKYLEKKEAKSRKQL